MVRVYMYIKVECVQVNRSLAGEKIFTIPIFNNVSKSFKIFTRSDTNQIIVPDFML